MTQVNTAQAAPYSVNSNRTAPTSLTGTYWPAPGQSIYDVALQLYGTTDTIFEIVRASGFDGLNDYRVAGRPVIFDITKRQDSLLGKHNDQNNVKYATGYNINPPPEFSYELRDDGGYELRDDGGIEIR